MRVFLFLFSISILCIQCKTEFDPNGRQIEKIERSVLNFVDGSELLLPNTDGTKIVYLIRHAEKDTAIKENPPLTEQGVARAEKIAEILKSTRVDIVFSTMYTRTLFTAQPLTQSKGLTMKPYTGDNLTDVAQQIKESDQQSFVIVGHSNTTPKMIQALTEIELPSIDENTYDDFFIVVLDNKNPQLYTLKY